MSNMTGVPMARKIKRNYLIELHADGTSRTAQDLHDIIFKTHQERGGEPNVAKSPHSLVGVAMSTSSDQLQLWSWSL